MGVRKRLFCGCCIAGRGGCCTGGGYRSAFDAHGHIFVSVEHILRDDEAAFFQPAEEQVFGAHVFDDDGRNRKAAAVVHDIHLVAVEHGMAGDFHDVFDAAAGDFGAQELAFEDLRITGVEGDVKVDRLGSRIERGADAHHPAGPFQAAIL